MRIEIDTNLTKDEWFDSLKVLARHFNDKSKYMIYNFDKGEPDIAKGGFGTYLESDYEKKLDEVVSRIKFEKELGGL